MTGISFLFISIVFFNYLLIDEEPNKYQNGADLEAMWHAEAQSLSGASNEQINEKLIKIKNEYSEASVFWVDETGKTMGKLPENQPVPPIWSTSLTIDFMKKNRGVKTGTVLSFLIDGTPYTNN